MTGGGDPDREGVEPALGGLAALGNHAHLFALLHTGTLSIHGASLAMPDGQRPPVVPFPSHKGLLIVFDLERPREIEF